MQDGWKNFLPNMIVVTQLYNRDALDETFPHILFQMFNQKKRV